ncbi:unnamed protein product [Moneuplotes crassus]|uniref:C2H2-type domain-containing protein n=1 Tax=Euplotes crassus TaxID=5936 RepID=A0AAD1USA4_EUPCR|nr:unnamed protein product [Moneuplotes crassus]
MNGDTMAIDHGFKLPPLNDVSYSLVPASQHFLGVLEVIEDTQFEQHTQIQTPSSNFPASPTLSWQELPKILSVEHMNPLPVVMNFPEQQSHLKHFPILKTANYSNRAKNIQNPKSQQSDGQVSSSKSSTPSDYLVKKVESNSSLDISSSQRWCYCGLTQEQSRLVQKVMTPTNMRFLNKLKCYEYEVQQDEPNSTSIKGCKFVCKFKGSCNKKFDRPWNLLDHCRMHKGVKPFGCYICGKKFTQKGNRNKHMNRHK